MEKKTDAPVAPAAKPSHILLLDNSKNWRAGTVLFATPDVIATLAKEGVKSREATALERGVAGFSS